MGLDAAFRFPSRMRQRALLAALGVMLVLGIAVDRTAPAGRPPATATTGDAALYRAIDTRIDHGEGFYPAAAAEQRARGFPLRPFVAMRMPTRAGLRHLLGARAMIALLWLLALAAIGATMVRLRALAAPTPLWTAASLLVVISVVPLANPVVALWPELWAGLLVTLSLACRSPRRWRLSVALGLAAVLFRELALPFLGAMGIAALLDRRRAETFAWAGAIVVALLAIAAHALAVRAVLLPHDAVSQGWTRAGGWRFDLSLAHFSTPLAALPFWVTAIVAPLALYGWAATADGYARRVAFAFAGWLLPFLLIGRPENSYWGVLMAPLWLAGVPLALPAVRATLRQ